MDPKQQPSKPLEPQTPLDTTDDAATRAPQPIAPFSSHISGLDELHQEPAAAATPGQVFGAPTDAPATLSDTVTAPVLDTNTAPNTDNKPEGDTTSTPVSIPIYDSTDSPASTAEAPEAPKATGMATQTPVDGEPKADDISITDSPSDDTPASGSTPSLEAMTPVSSALDADQRDGVPTLLPSADAGDVPPSPEGPGASQSEGHHKWLIALLLVLVVLIAGAAAAMVLLKKDDTKKTANAPVKVGFLMALTGGSSSMGYGTNKGIQLAKKQLNANNIEIVQADSKCDPKVAPEAIKRLIAQNVVAIIGDGCSSASTAALPAANNAKIPMISPSASTPSLTIPNDYFFRVVPNDTLQGAFMAQSIFDKGLRKIAVFYTNESYGSSMSKVFKEKFESLGGKVVTSVSAESDVIDLTTQMNTLKAVKPEGVFFSPNSVVSATAAIKVAREVGITAPFFGADAFYDTTIIKDAGQAAANGLTITSFPTGSKTFKQSLLNEYQVTEQLYGAAQAYDAFHAIYRAVKAGAVNGEQVAKMLPSIKFAGVSAEIAFDVNGEISNKDYKYALLQVKNGEFVAVE